MSYVIIVLDMVLKVLYIMRLALFIKHSIHDQEFDFEPCIALIKSICLMWMLEFYKNNCLR